MPPRLFTLEEALELLPTLRRLISDLQVAKQEFEERSLELERLLELSGGNGHRAANVASAREAAERAGGRLERLVADLHATGAELKGIDEGLVDFRTEREGRVVYLCWRQGEDTIAYWHELETGFAGRRPL